jgi:hypothetical protein
MTGSHYVGRSHDVGRCTACGKLLFLTRKAARDVARRMPEANRPRAYRCPGISGHWHVGHLPDAVRHGEITRQHYVTVMNRNDAHGDTGSPVLP